MNLQTEISLVRADIPEPYRDDPSDSFISDEEIVGWIQEGELQVATLLHHQALHTLQDDAAVSLTTVIGQSNYSLATYDYIRVIGARYNPDTGLGTTAGARGFRDTVLVDPERFWSVVNDPKFNRVSNYDKTYATIIDAEVWVWPEPRAANINALALRTIKRPTRRSKFYRFTGQTVSTTSIEAGALGQKPNSMATNAWQNCKMRVATIGNALWGEEHTVTSSSSTSGVFGFTNPDIWSATPNVGTEFEVGEVSDLPEHLYPLWIKWAVYRGQMKDRAEVAGGTLNEFRAMIQAINAQYGQPPLQEASFSEVVK